MHPSERGETARQQPSCGSRFNKWMHKYVFDIHDRYERVKHTKFRKAVHKFLHEPHVRITLNVLLICDLLLVVIALNLEIEFEKSELHDLEQAYEEAIDACTHGHSCHELHRFGNHSLEDGVQVLRFISIGILSLFVVENLLIIFEMGIDFFKHPFHVL
eukprot:m.506124 g.506124  ORF g.506124 m.506124 type:complete len:159 (+) comp21872_c0_seq1:452-928(+)